MALAVAGGRDAGVDEDKDDTELPPPKLPPPPPPVLTDGVGVLVISTV